jgi:hypothetical protein
MFSPFNHLTDAHTTCLSDSGSRRSSGPVERIRPKEMRAVRFSLPHTPHGCIK